MSPAHERLFSILFGVALTGIPLYSNVSEAHRLLSEGEHLAWLKNWQGAEPYFAKAEVAFRRRVSSILRHPAWEFTDFLPLSFGRAVPAC